MATRPHAIKAFRLNTRFTSLLPGITAAGCITALMVFAISALLGHADELSPQTLWHDPYLRHVTGFSFYQAFLSTLLSVVPAIPVAYALSRRQFIGRALLLRLFAMTLVLPVLVAVFGLLSIYGKSGLLNQWFAAAGWDITLNIYGLSGILLAHIFFKPAPRGASITAKFRRDPT